MEVANSQILNILGIWDNVNGLLICYSLCAYLLAEDLRFESNGGADDDLRVKTITGARRAEAWSREDSE
ncbi:hypothetical protein HAX54_035006 [Datura stramonium]|uniref:Uncharacterized protein n=1 Tax=Datura stramonium TaxID=4076 RepID=A0ABS8SEV1_DATST|nr:hypothetical protein [Datura stramonium]